MLSRLQEEFRSIVGRVTRFPLDYRVEVEQLIEFLKHHDLLPVDDRKRAFVAHVNAKFRLNAKRLADFYAAAAKRGITFNYHQKKKIQYGFDASLQHHLREVLAEKGVSSSDASHLMRLFTPVSVHDTMRYIDDECTTPSKLRREVGERDIAQEILQALFSAYLYVSLPERLMHSYFDPQYDAGKYRESFWEELHRRSPELFNREHALFIARITQRTLDRAGSYNNLRARILQLVAEAYGTLNNYGYLALIIEPLRDDGTHVQWRLAGEATIFAEKHCEVRLTNAYFQHRRVKDETCAYIEAIRNDPTIGFDSANEGLTYKDCFVMAPRMDSGNGEVSLLLLFQKNQRDETVVPCPRCRSHKVQGNSYSSLGVRSWECENLLCPERSKYNRGKRYSFRALAMQQAIEDARNQISKESVRRWIRDVQVGTTLDNTITMLLEHYSLYGDVVTCFDVPTPASRLGRAIRRRTLDSIAADSTLEKRYQRNGFFRRYRHERPAPKKRPTFEKLGDNDFQVFCGDAFDVLNSLPAASIDGAVTSPPYYNARDYAQWANIYCYLYDMYNINLHVFRVLRPGAFYYYNIFDCFDNERSIVFSAMGRKRMLLSAYAIADFLEIGFSLVGAITWDKGDIEGKRGFNAGNFSPYYQSPFNCYEHVLVFRKPARGPYGGIALPAILRAQPIVKMIGGENVHGHSAPYPDAIPELLLSRLKPGQVVLDPFAGSLTTGRVASRYSIRSINIERMREYCDLGLRMREAEQREATQLSLFAPVAKQIQA